MPEICLLSFEVASLIYSAAEMLLMSDVEQCRDSEGVNFERADDVIVVVVHCRELPTFVRRCISRS